MSSGEKKKGKKKEKSPQKGSYEWALVVIRVEKPSHGIGLRRRRGFRVIIRPRGNI
jgi:hypothetical protein